MKKDALLLRDLIEAAERILEYTSGGESAFLEDRRTQDAVPRNPMIIGEVAKALGDDARKRMPDIPWRRVAGMRDRLIHDYSAVRLDLVWTVVRDELPRLLEAARGAVASAGTD